MLQFINESFALGRRQPNISKDRKPHSPYMNLSDYRSEFAAYNSALELARYQHRAGHQRELEITSICERYGDLFTRDAIDDLQRKYETAPADQDTARAGLAALLAAARNSYLEASAGELTQECARCVASRRITWQGEKIPSSNVQQFIANETAAAARRELDARWMEAVATCNDLRAARLEILHESARTLGFDSYRALFTGNTGAGYQQLARAAENFLKRTEASYTTALAKATARDLPDVAFDELDHADLLFFQRTPRFDQLLPAQDLMKTYAAAMQGFGIRVDKQPNVHVDDQARAFKNPRAACFQINAPDDVRVLVAPTGGLHDYTTLFHAAGHAQHFAWSSRDQAQRHPEFVYSPDRAATEGYAFLFQHLFQDEAWIGEYMRSRIDTKQAREIVRHCALLTTYNLRRCCAKLKYEIALHDATDLRAEQLSATYATSQREATGFRHHPLLYLMDVDDGFYVAVLLRAQAFEAGLREHLRTRYGRRWWASARAGDELIDLWNTASRYSVEELARLIGFGEISFDLLAEGLVAEINGA